MKLAPLFAVAALCAMLLTPRVDASRFHVMQHMRHGMHRVRVHLHHGHEHLHNLVHHGHM